MLCTLPPSLSSPCFKMLGVVRACSAVFQLGATAMGGGGTLSRWSDGRDTAAINTNAHILLLHVSALHRVYLESAGIPL